MDKSIFLLLCAPLMPMAARAAKPVLGSDQTKPNIIFFMVDDMGWQDSSEPFWQDTTYLNSSVYHTPNMERLANCGVKFTRAYASPVSSPSRVSLMTGMHPAVHRVTNWTLHPEKSTDMPSDRLNFPLWNWNGLQPMKGVGQAVAATTLPMLLRQAGYHTIHVGKAHFGSIGTPGENPLNLGFDVNIAGHAAGGLASYLGEDNFGNKADASKQSPFAVPGLEKYWGQDIFVTEALTIEALHALDSARTLNKPFYLYMSHYAVHVPLDKDKRYFQKYIDAGLSDSQASYAALIEGMDKSLGDLMDYLQESGLWDNTVLIFMSDNGGLSTAGRSGKMNFPLNSGKGSAYEGGVRVPLIISTPEVRSEALCDTPVDICDMLPTIMNFAGQENYKTSQKLNGLSIVPLLKHESVQRFNRSLYWHFPNKWDAQGPGIGTFSSILRDKWKLIYFYENSRTELYNLDEDIFEVVNQAGNPSVAPVRKQLARDLTRFLKRTKAQMPTYKNGEVCNYPSGQRAKNR
ncbi:MAG: sulfatase-like hydrolase/transferase [Mucinivorans sp.]